MKTQLLQNVSLSQKTTFKIGGPAKYFAQPSSIDGIRECIDWADREGEPLFILGNGSNLLVSDNGWRGLVIDAGATFNAITWREDRALCLSGAGLGKLIRDMLDRGLRGLEHLAGIPGSIGGALVMNAGAYGHTITECVASVEFYDLDEKKVISLPAHSLEASYRHTVFFKKRAFILSGCFRFLPDPAGEAGEIVRQCGVKRREKHPLDLPNCGSVFKNLPGPIPAASLIEKSGLKGFRIGNAEVSRKHANFIVNLGGATAGDVVGIIKHVQETVRKEQGILLEPEVVMVGEFEEHRN